jgi:hypothetical protein
MMRGITKSPFTLMCVAASLMVAVACGDDEEDDGGDGDGGGKGGSSGSSTGGTSGSSGSSNGGSSGSSTGGSTGGSGRGGSTTGGSTTGGSAGSSTGGSAGNAGTSGAAGGGDEGGMGGIGGTDGGMGGAGGEGGSDVVFDELDNPGFEADSLDFWQESGDVDASFNQWTEGRNGTRKLAHFRQWVNSSTPAYSVSTFQTVSPIENGTYTFSMWVHRDQWFTAQYLFARGHDMADTAAELRKNTADNMSNSMYVQVVLPDIVVTSGQVTVGIHSEAPAGVWANIDDATLTKNP